MTKHLTKPVYFYDDNGYKIGPVRKRDLIAFAENGTINPETRITDDKIEVRAKQIPNLKFCAPEYRKAEEMFDPENIDFDSMPKTVYLKPKENINPPSATPTQVECQTNNDTSKLTQQDVTIAIFKILGFIAIICFFVFDMPTKLGIIPKFKPPEINFELKRVEIPERVQDGFGELQDRFKENLGLEKLAEELRENAQLPKRNVPFPPRPNR